MKQDYFEHDGKRYYTGTIIKVKQWDYAGNKACEKNATFLWYNPENKRTAIQIEHHYWDCTKEYYDRIFICVTDLVDKRYVHPEIQKKELTLNKELNIDGLFIAWTWYILIMGLAVIFNDRICIWLLASYVFFNYRNKKLKEAGYK